MSPFCLSKGAHICGSHFHVNQFTSVQKKRLKNSAVPNKCLPDELSEDEIDWYKIHFGHTTGNNLLLTKCDNVYFS